MSDWHETGEGQEKDVRSDSKDTPLSQQGQHSMQGPAEVAVRSVPPDSGDDDGGSDVSPAREKVFPDQKYTDGKGNDLAMRTHPNGDSYMVRVYDSKLTPEPPDDARFGDAGRANLLLERGTDDVVERAKLQDIDTTPSYREAGTGSRMLSQCEEIARQNGAGEIYGVLEREDERQWYTNRGYAFRGDGGRELYKRLATDLP